MKLTEHFRDFLNDAVNLNQDRIDTLEARVETIKTFLVNSDYEAPIAEFSAQGSWAHKTIIRPSKGKEFDADLVAYVAVVDGWMPRDYVLELRRIFRASDRYRDLTRLKTRCVSLDYAGDFHLDVVPIVVEADSSENPYSICNRTDDLFEPTDGDGYADWWRAQDGIAGGQLKKVTRLLKYLRDIKNTFSIKSVLFTTLIGQQVTASDLFVPANFVDLPTSLKTIIGRLDDWLQDRPDLPEVENPALAGESFTRNWTQDQYEDFRDRIHDYRDWIDDAFDDTDRDESIRKWRRVFGDEFAKGETVEQATKAVATLAERYQPGRDLVTVVSAYGRGVLANMPQILPHVEPSPYAPAPRQIPVRVVAYEKRTRGGNRVREVTSGDLIEAQSGIEFQALQYNSGLPFPKDYDVRWQVVNTDRAAAAANCLRGDFYPSNTHGYRYEETKYRGVHWVQAYLVNRRSGLLDGVSERFFVVIQ